MNNILKESREYIEKQKSINEELNRKYGNRASLDGIFYPDKYFASGSKRIVFVLKETYSPPGNPAYSPIPDPDNTDSITDSNMACKVLVKSFGKDNRLSGVGYVNISKKAKDLIDGKTRSEHASLKKQYQIDKSIFWKQLTAINPRYVICGGTFCYLWNDLEQAYGDLFYKVKFTSDHEFTSWNESKLSLWRMKDKAYPVFIQTYHPSCPGNVFKLIPNVIRAYEEEDTELFNY